MILLLKHQVHLNGLKEFTILNLNNLSNFLSYFFRNTLFSTWKVNGKVAGYRKQVGLF